jgi:hypothetical protein
MTWLEEFRTNSEKFLTRVRKWKQGLEFATAQLPDFRTRKSELLSGQQKLLSGQQKLLTSQQELLAG